MLNLLDINNRCDLAYKTSNNKRIHLELALMQMCSATVQQQKKTLSAEKPRPAPAAQVTPVKLKDLKENVSGTISIKKAVAPPVVNPEVSEDPVNYNKANSFTREDLNAAWSDCVSQLKTEMPHLYNSLVQSQPVLKDDFTIEITLENKLLETDLLKKKGEILGFLRTRLDNHKLNLTAKVEGNSRESKPYTDKEKFEKMAAKNPSLRKLREELDLEIEY